MVTDTIGDFNGAQAIGPGESRDIQLVAKIHFQRSKGRRRNFSQEAPASAGGLLLFVVDSRSPSSASIPLYSPERSHEGRGSIADGFAAPGLVSPPLPGADANSNEEGILPLNADLPRRRPLLVKEFFEQQLRQPPGVVAQHAVFLDEI